MVSLASACADVPASNPFDPATPAAQQQRGRVVGAVRLPAGFGADRLTDGLARLYAADSPAMPAYEAAVEVDAEGERVAGRFTFGGVEPGLYRVAVQVRGFRGEPRAIALGIGAALDVGVLDLQPSEDAVIQGAALLAGDAVADHGGTLIEALGTPYTALTAADGAFRLDLPPGTYTLRAGHAGYAPVERADVEARAGDVALLDPPLTLDGAPGRLVGTVALEPGFEDRDALAGVAVTTRPAGDPDAAPRPVDVQLDEAGQARISAELPAGDYVVRVALDGFFVETRAVTVPVGAAVDLGHVVLRSLPRTATIEGVAQIQGGADHTGIQVELAGTPARVETNSEGRFALPVPVRSDAYTLRFHRAGYNDAQVEVPGLGPDAVHALADPVVLVGQPGTVHGIVRIDERFDIAALLPRVEVRLRPVVDGEAGEARVATPTVNGVFEFTPVAAGSYVLEVALEGFFSGFRAPTVPVGQRVSVGVVPLSPNQAQATLTGSARLPCVAPPCDHGGIRVEAIGAPFVAFTNAAGDFYLPVVAGEYTLRYVRPGYATEQQGPVFVDAGQLQGGLDDVVLRALPGRVLGRLSLPDGFDAAAIFARATVDVGRVGEDAAVHRGEVFADGLFVVEGVPVGEWQVRLTVPGFTPEAHRATLEAGGAVDLGVIALGIRRPSTLSGRVRLEDEASHGGIQVTVRGQPFATLTSDEGDFVLQVLADQPQEVVFGRAGFEARTLALEGVAVGEQRALPAPLVLPYLRAQVTGVVRRPLADGQTVPAAGATVTVRGVEGEAAQVGVTDGEGVYTVGDLRGGPHLLRVDLDRHGSVERAVQLVAGETVIIEPLIADVQRGGVAGAGSRDDARGQGGVTVLAVRLDDDLDLGPVVRATTASEAPDDAYGLRDLPVGTWQVTALADGYRPQATDRVVVRAGQDTPHDVVVTRRVHRLTAPAVVDRAPIPVTLTGDADLTQRQVWVDAPAPPAGSTWRPLPAGGAVTVPADGDGPHVVRARLATQAYVDDGDPVLRAVSPLLEATVVVDGEPPELVPPQVGEGTGYVRSADGAVQVQVTCVDRWASAAELRLTIDLDGATLYDGPYRPVLTTQLGPDEGPKTLTFTCADVAGNSAVSDPVTVLHDHTPPTVRAFCLDGGCAPPAEVLTSALDRAVTLDVVDTLAGGVTVALGERAADCADAAYALPGQGDVVYRMAPGEGRRTLWLCARDAAGNVTSAAVESSNAVRVDTTPPPAPTLQGPAFSRALALTLGLAERPDDPGLRVEVDGDVEPTPARPVDGPDLPVTLTAPDGPKLINAAYVDAAGNRSRAAQLLLQLDRQAPAPGTVVVADGNSAVRQRVVPISFRDTTADHMRLTVEAACDEGPWDCADARLVPFSPIATVTVSGGRGPKRICWQLCDAAGNATPMGQATVTLEVPGDRPRPVLTSLSPDRIPLSDAAVSVEITGAALAADTEARVGALLLPCVPPGGAGADCVQTDAGPVDCADRCTVTLPPAFTGRAGSHFVRLVTPQPVADGLGESIDTLGLDVVAPLPRITRVVPRGVATTDALVPNDAAPVDVTLYGCHFARNAQYLLGGNVGTPCPDCALTPADEEDARCPDGVQRITVRMPLAGLRAGATPQTLQVRNPAPGGGDATVPFGVNLDPASCLEGCVVPAAATWAPRAAGGVRQALLRPSASVHGAVRVTGATGVVARDVDGRPRQRVEVARGGGLLPFAFFARGPTTPIEVEDAFATGQRIAVTNDVHLTRGDGTFRRLPRFVAAGNLSTMRLLHLDDDDTLDLLLDDTAGDSIVTWAGVGDGTFTRRRDVTGVQRSLDLAAADFDLDGHVDVVHTTDLLMTLSLYPGRAGAPLDLQVPLVGLNVAGATRSYALAVADVDGDRLPDLLAGQTASVAVAVGSGDLLPSRFVRTAWPATPRDLVVGDLDADGRIDVVTADNDGNLTVGIGRGDGTFAVAFRVGGDTAALALADLNLDGAPDIVGLAQDETAVRVWCNRGDGGPLAPSHTVFAPGEGVGARGFAVADLDGDARPDVVVVAEGDGDAGTVRWAHGNGDGTLDLRPALGDGARAVVAGDLNGDGAIDLLTHGDDDAVVYLAAPVAPVALGQHVAHPAVRHGGFLATHPRADGTTLVGVKSHAVVDAPGEAEHAQVLVLGRDGQVLASQTHATGSPIGAVAFADVDDDGQVDFLATGLHDVLWWAGPDFTTPGGPLGLTRANGDALETLWSMRAADVDGDGDDDLVVMCAAEWPLARGTVLYRVDHGAAGLLAVASRSIPGLDGQQHFELRDVTGDGHLDALVITDDSVDLFSMDGGGLQSRGSFDVRLVRGGTVSLIDLDLDGALDIISRTINRGHHRTTVTYDVLGPAPALARPETHEPGGALRAIDLNGDQYPDTFTVQGGNRLEIAPRQGDRYPYPVAMPIGSDTVDLHPVDVNRDGVLDLIGLSRTDSLIDVWIAPGAQRWAMTQRLELPTPAAVTEATPFTVAQPMQRLDAVAVRARLDVDGPRAVDLVVAAPDGSAFGLTIEPPDGDDGPWSRVVMLRDVEQAAFAPLIGAWMPNGDWTLVVDPAQGDAAVRLVDFSVSTYGAFGAPTAP